jgi:hypothetical protein
MPQTRMFRDRMVSMEQTLERGEKHLEFLKSICQRAFPDFEYREHFLDHERDLFVMVIAAADGRRRSIGWTRMVLFDAERLPALVTNPDSALAEKMVTFLRERSGRPDIVVTFRHLEEGWVDTPEPRREKRRGRRGRGDSRGRRDERRVGSPQPGGRPSGSPPGPPPQRQDRETLAAANRAPAGPEGETAPGQRPGGRRRRFRRRRGRRGGGGTNPAGRPASTP